MKHVQKVIAHYRKNNYDGQDEWMVHAVDHTKFDLGWVRVCEVEINFETPDDFNPVAVQVEALKAKEAKLTEQFAFELNQVRLELSKLQAITFEAPETTTNE